MALKKDRPHRGPTDTDAVLKKLKNVFFRTLLLKDLHVLVGNRSGECDSRQSHPPRR
jgi:hypothetical protein